MLVRREREEQWLAQARSRSVRLRACVRSGLRVAVGSRVRGLDVVGLVAAQVIAVLRDDEPVPERETAGPRLPWDALEGSSPWGSPRQLVGLVGTCGAPPRCWAACPNGARVPRVPGVAAKERHGDPAARYDIRRLEWVGLPGRWPRRRLGLVLLGVLCNPETRPSMCSTFALLPDP